MGFFSVPKNEQKSQIDSYDNPTCYKCGNSIEFKYDETRQAYKPWDPRKHDWHFPNNCPKFKVYRKDDGTVAGCDHDNLIWNDCCYFCGPWNTKKTQDMRNYQLKKVTLADGCMVFCCDLCDHILAQGLINRQKNLSRRGNKA